MAEACRDAHRAPRNDEIDHADPDPHAGGVADADRWQRRAVAQDLRRRDPVRRNHRRVRDRQGDDGLRGGRGRPARQDHRSRGRRPGHQGQPADRRSCSKRARTPRGSAMSRRPCRRPCSFPHPTPLPASGERESAAETPRPAQAGRRESPRRRHGRVKGQPLLQQRATSHRQTDTIRHGSSPARWPGAWRRNRGSTSPPIQGFGAARAASSRAEYRMPQLASWPRSGGPGARLLRHRRPALHPKPQTARCGG